ncbi:MAG: nucleotide disphospho-sugar-binding domain-containing protein [Bosea sp. (in: a-proteobacteria)]
MVRQRQLARALVARGFRVSFAACRLDYADMIDVAGDIFPAPYWTGMVGWRWPKPDYLDEMDRGALLSNLGRIGATYPRGLINQQRAWAGLINQIRPDIIIGDYAPGAMLAGKLAGIPTVAIGTWQTVGIVRDGMLVTSEEPSAHEMRLFDEITTATFAAAEAVKRPVPSCIATAYRGDLPLPAGLSLLDPYAAIRNHAMLPPEMRDRPMISDGGGHEVLGYLNFTYNTYEPLLHGLARQKMALALEGMQPAFAEWVRRQGTVVRDTGFSGADLAARASLFINHGGLGSVQLGLFAGVPQLLLPCDGEKRTHARILLKLGVALSIEAKDANTQTIAEAVHQIRDTPAMAQRARELARSLATLYSGRPVEDIRAEAILSAYGRGQL